MRLEFIHCQLCGVFYYMNVPKLPILQLMVIWVFLVVVFFFLVIMHAIAMNILVQISLCTCVRIPLGCLSRSGMAES